WRSAHDRESQNSDDGCLIQLDNFRGATSSTRCSRARTCSSRRGALADDGLKVWVQVVECGDEGLVATDPVSPYRGGRSRGSRRRCTTAKGIAADTRGRARVGSPRWPSFENDAARRRIDLMDRRMFLGALAGGLLAAPLAVEAQQPAMPVIGFLHSGSLDGW